MTQQKKTFVKYLRIGLPIFLIAGWLVLGGLGGPLFGKISSVTSNDQSTFLPKSAESTLVNKELAKFQSTNAIPALIVFGDGAAVIGEGDLGAIRTVSAGFADVENIEGTVSPPILSEDKKAAIVVASMNTGAEYKIFVSQIREKIDAAQLEVPYHIAGPVGLLNDLTAAFAGIDGLLLGVALAVVFIILLLVYRSVLLPVIVLINSVFALCGAILVVFLLAKAGILTVNGQVQGILFILVIGAATDYSLLFVSRFREELTRHAETYQALLASWKRSFEPIVAAGGTVIVGVLCLLLSDLSSNKALGPVGAIGVLFAITASLTLLPSILLLFGRTAFWPRAPKQSVTQQTISLQAKGLWPATGRFVKKHARSIWSVTIVALIVMSLGIFQLKADGVPQSEFVLGSSSARDGQRIINNHFAGGIGTPAQIIVAENDLEKIIPILEEDDGVASSTLMANGSPTGSLPLDAKTAALPLYKNAQPKIIDGEVVVEATLEDAADSEAAQTTVQRLRDAFAAAGVNARVGGVSAVQLDTKLTSERDRAVIIPVVLVVITVILMLLLRSLLAPLILLGTTILSFLATLGVAALVFNHIFHFPGADPSVVLYGFVFLVALGIDYNIFLMTRVREESLRSTTRKGVLIGLIVTGGVITSAGIVLAATFAALAVIPILFLAQLAFVVAFGVLLDTIVIRSLLVPAIVHQIGEATWWPAKTTKRKTAQSKKRT